LFGSERMPALRASTRIRAARVSKRSGAEIAPSRSRLGSQAEKPYSTAVLRLRRGG
jgi:hypothetical protein